jgi:predicted  nucleic acid-binding Zn-ribbon protein
MQLRVARLCLDCEEVHESQQCPACASESFAYLSRWIPAPERRSRPRSPENDPAVDRERLEAMRGLSTGRVLTGGMVGLGAVSLIGWLWRRGSEQGSDRPTLAETRAASTPARGDSPQGEPGKGVRESVDR